MKPAYHVTVNVSFNQGFGVDVEKKARIYVDTHPDADLKNLHFFKVLRKDITDQNNTDFVVTINKSKDHVSANDEPQHRYILRPHEGYEQRPYVLEGRWGSFIEVPPTACLPDKARLEMFKAIKKEVIDLLTAEAYRLHALETE